MITESLQAQKDIILDDITTLHLMGTRSYMIMKDDRIVESGYNWISDEQENLFKLAHENLSYIESLLREAKNEKTNTKIQRLSDQRCNVY